MVCIMRRIQSLVLSTLIPLRGINVLRIEQHTLYCPVTVCSQINAATGFEFEIIVNLRTDKNVFRCYLNFF